MLDRSNVQSDGDLPKIQPCKCGNQPTENFNEWDSYCLWCQNCAGRGVSAFNPDGLLDTQFDAITAWNLLHGLSDAQQKAIQTLRDNGMLHPNKAKQFGVTSYTLESLYRIGRARRYTSADTIQHIYFERNPKADLAYELI